MTSVLVLELATGPVSVWRVPNGLMTDRHVTEGEMAEITETLLYLDYELALTLVETVH